jgi:hypothetical protein
MDCDAIPRRCEVRTRLIRPGWVEKWLPNKFSLGSGLVIRLTFDELHGEEVGCLILALRQSR